MLINSSLECVCMSQNRKNEFTSEGSDDVAYDAAVVARDGALGALVVAGGRQPSLHLWSALAVMLQYCNAGVRSCVVGCKEI